MIGFFEFYIAPSEILLTACADKLLSNNLFNQIMFDMCVQDTAVKTVIDVCSFLAKQTFSDLVRKRPSSLIINFEQVIISSLKYSFHFFLTSG